MASIQIFVYNTSIKLNFPMINFSSKNELIEFVNKLDFEKKESVIENGNTFFDWPKEPHFVINNPQMLPNEIILKHNENGLYYPIKTNLDLLMSKISSMSNSHEEFIEFLNNSLTPI